jgi:antitoxin HicB
LVAAGGKHGYDEGVECPGRESGWRIEMHDKLPLVFEPQPEGGFTVTSPLIPELITEGDTLDDAFENVRDALAAVLEAYRETGKALPPNLAVPEPEGPISAEMVISVP